MALGKIDSVVTVLCALVAYGAASNSAFRHSEAVSVAIGVPHTGHQVGLKHRNQLDELERILIHGRIKKITMKVSTSSNGEIFDLYLSASPLLMPKSLKLTYFTDSGYNSTAQYRYIDTKSFSCFYTTEDSVGTPLSHIEMCQGQLQGDITSVSNQTFHIYMLEGKEGLLNFFITEVQVPDEHGQCGNNDLPGPSNQISHRQVRSAIFSHPPANHNDTTRYIELYIVVDHQLYLRSGSDLEKATQRVVNIVNYASSLFLQMNIYLALVGVEVWAESNKISVNGEAKNVLEAFEAYRMNQINPNTPNDNANLFVAEKFSHSTIGQSSVSMCIDLGGSAVTSDHYEPNYIIAATTMAHEIGHNLGLVHDDALENAEECVCPRKDLDDDKCIMYSKSAGIQPIAWSQCSIKFVQDSFQKHGKDYCLKNLPDPVKLESSCGNYFVEEGEECDCGPSEECSSKCCEPLTCKFTKEAHCATGSCCDVDTCQLKSAATICRNVSNEACDLPEYCDGTSEWCPADTFMANGVECSAPSTAYCYEGECKTRDTQCEYVWGDGSISGIDKCYTRWNVYGEYYGNCGYSIDARNSSPVYKACLPEDTMCGLLQCSGASLEPVLQLGLRTKYPGQVSLAGERYQCSIIIYDVGLDTPDPGLVPDGAACGNSSWCMEQHCVERPQLPVHCSCSGVGRCNQYYECHCNDGFDPRSNCLEPGPGGSMRSGPQSIYSTPYAAPATTSKAGWVTPLVVTLLVVAVAVTVIVVVVKRRKLQSCWKKHRPEMRQRYALGKPNNCESPAPKPESKFPSLATNSGGNNSRRHGFISTPILESTTNQSMKLRDIPNAPLAVEPISNPTYSSKEFKDPEAVSLTSREENAHTYSVCKFDSDSDSDSEEVNAYEDMPLAVTDT